MRGKNKGKRSRKERKHIKAGEWGLRDEIEKMIRPLKKLRRKTGRAFLKNFLNNGVEMPINLLLSN